MMTYRLRPTWPADALPLNAYLVRECRLRVMGDDVTKPERLAAVARRSGFEATVDGEFVTLVATV